MADIAGAGPYDINLTGFSGIGYAITQPGAPTSNIATGTLEDFLPGTALDTGYQLVITLANGCVFTYEFNRGTQSWTLI